MATRSTSSTSASRARGESENRSASRVLEVLDLFLDDGSWHTLKDVSEQLEIPKSTAHGILHAMHRHGYLTLDPDTKTYAISLRLVGRTAATPVIEILRRRARRHLERLASMLGETAKLVGYEGTHSVAIDFAEGERPLKYTVRLGQQWPHHATGGGKLYLARYSNDEVRELLGQTDLEKVTANTIVDIDALLEELDEVRRVGWARQREEIHDGISGFAAPVIGLDGKLLASIVVMGPTARIDERQETIIAELVAAARALGADVGALDPTEPADDPALVP